MRRSRRPRGGGQERTAPNIARRASGSNPRRSSLWVFSLRPPESRKTQTRLRPPRVADAGSTRTRGARRTPRSGPSRHRRGRAPPPPPISRPRRRPTRPATTRPREARKAKGVAAYGRGCSPRGCRGRRADRSAARGAARTRPPNGDDVCASPTGEPSPRRGRRVPDPDAARRRHPGGSPTPDLRLRRRASPRAACRAR